jgi:hypothetical protein
MSYPVIPRFDSYARYWSNGPADNAAARVGIADYSSRGFFTKGNNFGNTAYPLPASDECLYATEAIVTPESYIDEYFVGSVPDPLRGSGDVIRMTRRSLWADAIGSGAGGCGIGSARAGYTIDDAIHDQHANLLIPRAVAYSAGLLDYFFRGTMEITPPDEGVYAMVDHSVEKSRDVHGFGTLKLKLANTSAGDAMTGGTVVAVLRFRRDTCYVDDLSGAPNTGSEALACRSVDPEITVSDPVPLPDGLGRSPEAFTFNFPLKLPINAIDVMLQVAYRGVLGNESDAVAIGAKDLSEPTFFDYHNATDFIHIGARVYTRDEVNSDAALLARVQPQACVDYTLNPPQLVASCMNPLAINLVLGTGTAPKTAIIVGLPVRRFARIALLAEGETTTVAQLTTSCQPSTPFLISNLLWQMETDADTGAQVFHYPAYVTLRGIKGWIQTSCVLAGDGFASGATDDRAQRMDVVDEKHPFPTQILPP